MARQADTKDSIEIPVEVTLQGILALLVAERGDREEKADRSTEALLADAGLSLNQIARLTGGEYESVKGLVRRDREKRKKAGRTEGNAPR